MAPKRPCSTNSEGAKAHDKVGKRAKRLQKMTPEQFSTMRTQREILRMQKCGDVDGAVDLYRRAISEPSTDALEAASGAVQTEDGPFEPSLCRLGQNHIGQLLFIISEGNSVARFHSDAREMFGRLETVGATKRISENIYAAMIRIECAAQKLDAARRLLAELRDSGQHPRLREYAPIVALACRSVSSSNVAEAVQLYDEMKAALLPPLLPSEDEYLAMLEMCCRLMIAGAEGDYAAELNRIWDRVLVDYFETVTVPSSSFRDVAQCWYGKFALPPSGSLVAMASAQASSNARVGRWSVSFGVQIDEDTARCSASDATLRSIDLSSGERQVLLEQVAALGSNRGREPFVGFARWLESNASGGAFDCVIDGANVGYYKAMGRAKAAAESGRRGGDQAVFSYAHIDKLVKHLENHPRHPRKCLIVLHRRHTAANRLQRKEDRAIVENWKRRRQLYLVNPPNNDDWFWLYATAWIGGRCTMVSNDEMLDHHFQMLQGRSFLNWKERHQTAFEMFTDRHRGTIAVKVFEPSIYSKRAQRSLDGRSFHIPMLVAKRDQPRNAATAADDANQRDGAVASAAAPGSQRGFRVRSRLVEEPPTLDWMCVHWEEE